MHVKLKKYEYIENQTRVIQNIHGQYWTGECWGVRQAAMELRPGEWLPEIPGLELENCNYWYLPGEDEPFASLVKK